MAGCLEAAGLSAGAVQLWNFDNLKGNRESLLINELNDAVLKYSGGRWDSPPEELKWTNDHIQRRDDVLSSALATNSAGWCFKEPRTLITLPFWLHRTPPINFVGTFRDPIKVAVSLLVRPFVSIPLRRGLQLWLDYNRRLLAQWEKHPFPLISFDLQPKNYTQRLKQIIGELNQWMDLSPDNAETFFAQELRQSHPIRAIAANDEEQKLIDDAQALHEQLCEISNCNTGEAAQHAFTVTPSMDVAFCAGLSDSSKSDPYAIYCLGKAHTSRGDFEAASHAFETAANIDPSFPHIALTTADSFQKAGKLDRALGIFEAELDRRKVDPELHYRLGKTHEMNGDTESARKYFKIALEIFETRGVDHNTSTYRQCVYGALSTLCSEQSFEDALDVAKCYEQQGLKTDLLYRLKARAETQIGRFDDALKSAERATELNPEVAMNHHILGNALLRKKDATAARIAFMITIKLNPQLIWAHKGLGDALLILGQPLEALECFNEANRLLPDNKIVLLGKGRSHLRLGEKIQARAAIEAALKIDPNFQPASDVLSKITGE